eukprot:TRINITY_DN4911_c0_g2_i1.p1 TRINITY_DN4911_c0_g2~~TRINITY_DN4911_c0_g2_i1.p1  ORF type:complete len:143 (-),score=41.49 TRINITY_DN4911_c0_g2_i1:29-427(-)
MTDIDDYSQVVLIMRSFQSLSGVARAMVIGGLNEIRGENILEGNGSPKEVKPPTPRGRSKSPIRRKSRSPLRRRPSVSFVRNSPIRRRSISRSPESRSSSRSRSRSRSPVLRRERRRSISRSPSCSSSTEDN